MAENKILSFQTKDVPKIALPPVLKKKSVLQVIWTRILRGFKPDGSSKSGTPPKIIKIHRIDEAGSVIGDVLKFIHDKEVVNLICFVEFNGKETFECHLFHTSSADRYHLAGILDTIKLKTLGFELSDE